IGGGLAPTGGYVVGKAKLVDLIARRLTAPSVGAEIGSYAYGYQYYFEGLFLAPHIVSQALKTALLFSHSLSKLGYKTLPNINDKLSDIVCSITLNDKSKLIKFVQAIQKVSPIDSNVVPFPWDMPGYEDKVIMAAGCFVLGSSIELSCDSPIKPPYIAYLQGGLTFEHGRLALAEVLKDI
ncbi:MAG: methionine gamma-lyase family protein, partial [Clostridia bacterium]